MIIAKVMQSKHTEQKTVTIPKKSDINKGDHVIITKVKGEQVMAEKNLSALAKTKTESSHKTKGRKINEEIRNEARSRM